MIQRTGTASGPATGKEEGGDKKREGGERGDRILLQQLDLRELVGEYELLYLYLNNNLKVSTGMLFIIMLILSSTKHTSVTSRRRI